MALAFLPAWWAAGGAAPPAAAPPAGGPPPAPRRLILRTIPVCVLVCVMFWPAQAPADRELQHAFPSKGDDAAARFDCATEPRRSEWTHRQIGNIGEVPESVGRLRLSACKCTLQHGLGRRCQRAVPVWVVIEFPNRGGTCAGNRLRKHHAFKQHLDGSLDVVAGGLQGRKCLPSRCAGEVLHLLHRCLHPAGNLGAILHTAPSRAQCSRENNKGAPRQPRQPHRRLLVLYLGRSVGTVQGILQYI